MSASWWSALVCVAAVGAMGFAIQRGGTCTVAAVDELLSQRRARRVTAMLEASLWVAGGLTLAQLVDAAGSMPAGYAISAWTVIGGVLLGLGAWVNGACVFGAVARLGLGQWAQALTPVGFFCGALAAAGGMARLAIPGEMPSAAPSPLWSVGGWLAPLFVLYVLWRAGGPLLGLLRGNPGGTTSLAAKVWSPHAATIIIGVSFVITFVLAGRWAYTDVLADLAHGMARGGWPGLALPGLLLVALYAGALFGGWTAGRWRQEAPSPGALLRALAGGGLMGAGSLLIPGSNDGLLLVGIPLLRPYAWLALVSMCLAIAAAFTLQRRRVARDTKRTAWVDD